MSTGFPQFRGSLFHLIKDNLYSTISNMVASFRKIDRIIANTKPFLTSFILNTSVFVLAVLFCDFKYEISDDFIMEGVLAGAFTGTTDPHLLFTNILLGYLLKPLYDTFPIVSFYFVFLELIGFLSLCAISACVIERFEKRIGIPLALIVIMVFSDDLYILPSFTKTAVAACVAGGVMFLYAVFDFSTKRIIPLALSLFLLLSGILLRQMCLLMVLPLLFMVFVFEAYRRLKNADKKCYKKHILRSGIVLAACIAVILLSYGMVAIDSALWTGDGERFVEYKNFNHLRATVVDTVYDGYESVSDCYDEMGLTRNDFDMIHSWNFLDRSVYTDDLLEKIASAEAEDSNQVYHSFDGIAQAFIQRSYLTYSIVIGTLVIMGLLIMINPRNAIPSLICFLTGLALFFVTYYRGGRYPYRVEFGIVFAGATVMLMASESIRDTDVKRTKTPVSVAIIASLVFLFKLPLYYPDSSNKTKNADEYKDYVYSILLPSGYFGPNKYRLEVDEDVLCSDLYELIYSDKDHYYLFDFHSTIQRTFYSYNPWFRVPKCEWRDEYFYLGGVTTMYPSNLDVWETNGIDPYDPYKSLVNDNIYVIDNVDINIKLQYLRRYYYPNARVEFIDNVDGFDIWKFYIE